MIAWKTLRNWIAETFRREFIDNGKSWLHGKLSGIRLRWIDIRSNSFFFKSELERLFVNSGFEKIAKIKLGSRSVFARNYYFSGKLIAYEARNFSKPRNVNNNIVFPQAEKTKLTENFRTKPKKNVAIYSCAWFGLVTTSIMFLYLDSLSMTKSITFFLAFSKCCC